MHKNEKRKQRRQELVSSGICIDCYAHHNDGTLRCSNCRERLSGKQQQYAKRPEIAVREKTRRREYARRPEVIARRVQRRRNSVTATLANNLRSRLRLAIKNQQKAGSAVADLGCSISELKQHLESQFQTGMNWQNYGQWHIDHIQPLASFNLEDREQFLAANHYTNLQPLWAEDNLRKGDHYGNN